MFDVDLAEVGEIVNDALPFEQAAAGRETVDQLLAQDEGEKGAEDVAADAGVGFVEDRAGGEQRLCGCVSSEGWHVQQGTNLPG